MRMSFWTAALATLLCSGVQADVWDVGGDNDNDFGSDNELVHGLDQIHDMAAQQGGTVEDVDWYSLRRPCNASYEILLEGLTGDVSNGTTSPALELLASDATTVLIEAVPVSSLGVDRRIGVYCYGANSDEIVNYVRVSQPSCGLSCTGEDQYHIRFRDTTALISRFNNSATQVTVLVLQNSTGLAVTARGDAYDSTGAWIGFLDLELVPNQVTTVNLSTADGGFLAGKSGALKIVSSAPYGALAGKAVAVEPATGFTFDTPLVYKPY